MARKGGLVPPFPFRGIRIGGQEGLRKSSLPFGPGPRTGSTATRASGRGVQWTWTRPAPLFPAPGRWFDRVDGATHRAACRRGAMKTFELPSIIGSIVAVGITLDAVVIGTSASIDREAT